MKLEQFGPIVKIIKDAWPGNAYTKPKIDSLWRLISKYDATLVESVIENLVSTGRSVPQPFEIAEACRESAHHARKSAPRVRPGKIQKSNGSWEYNCTACFDCGTLIGRALHDHPTKDPATDHPYWRKGDEFVFACPCASGNAMTAEDETYQVPRLSGAWRKWFEPAAPEQILPAERAAGH